MNRKFSSVTINDLKYWHNIKLQKVGKYWKGKYLMYKNRHFYFTEEFIEKCPGLFKTTKNVKSKNG